MNVLKKTKAKRQKKNKKSQQQIFFFFAKNQQQQQQIFVELEQMVTFFKHLALLKMNATSFFSSSVPS